MRRSVPPLVLALLSLAAAARPGRSAPVPRDARAEAVAAAVGRLADRLKADPTPRTRPGDKGTAIYMADLTTGGVTLFASASDTEWPNPAFGSPNWSADGERIYYDVMPAVRDYGNTLTHAIRASAAGLDRSVLCKGNCPDPSPDGPDVALVFLYTPPGGDRGVHVVGANGGTARPLGVFGVPRWSPDGRAMLVSQYGSPTTFELTDLTGGDRRPVALAGHTFQSFPRWVAADTVVVVAKDRAGAWSVVLLDITKPDQAAVKQTLWRQGDGLPADVVPVNPVYSAAAGRGAFVGRTKAAKVLYVFEPGKVPRAVEPGRTTGNAADPSLSPDGRYVLFSDGKRD